MFKSSPFAIYALYDPTTNKMRYVGQTRVGVKARLESHIRSAGNKTKNAPVQAWIRCVLGSGKQPYIKVLQYIKPGPELERRINAAEKLWIFKYRYKKNLLNVTSGGDQWHGRGKKVAHWVDVLSWPT